MGLETIDWGVGGEEAQIGETCGKTADIVIVYGPAFTVKNSRSGGVIAYCIGQGAERKSLGEICSPQG